MSECQNFWILLHLLESTDVPAECYAMHPLSVSHDKVQHMVMFVIYTCMSLFQKEYVS